ncbi:hypothetical protein N2152v2_005167 [Parachlorella kessleri]
MVTIGNHCHSAYSPHLSATLEKLAALHSPASTEQGAADVTVAAPVLNVSGGGIFFFWKAGVLKYLTQHHDLSSLKLRGASAGALIVALAACEVDIDRAVERAHELAVEYGVYSRPLGLAGVWGGLVRQWLYDVLPDDAHTRRVVVTVLPSLKPLLLDSFDSKEDVIDACMASAHVPFFLDGKLSASLPSLIPRAASLTPKAKHQARQQTAARSVNDKGSSRCRRCSSGGGVEYASLEQPELAMLKLVTQEGVQLLMQRGMEYAQRMHAEGPRAKAPRRHMVIGKAPTIPPPSLPITSLCSSPNRQLFHTVSGGRRSNSRRRRLTKLQKGLLTALLVVLVLAAVVQIPGIKRNIQDTYNKAYYGLDARLLGRRDTEFPVKRCCVADACQQMDRKRYALVTYIRTDAYLPLLRQLVCTTRKSNPWLDIAIMVVPGELSDRVERFVTHSMNATIIYVKRLEYQNDYETRYSWNWLKIRAFGLTQYDAILLMDSDAIVVGNVRQVFDLPTDFAAVWDQSKWMNKHKTIIQGINGGVLFIRPCAATELGMQELLSDTPKLRFSHGTAEQDFFAWYFRYTGMILPLEYNAMASESLDGDVTVGGVPPRIVHFTGEKPFQGPRGGPGHQFLCRPDQLEGTWPPG